MSAETFTDLLEQRNELLHRKALLAEVVEHLEKFMDSDASQTEIGIVSTGEGRIVPQQIIEAERDDLNTQITKIEEILTDIDNRKVTENEQEVEAEDKTEEPSKGKGPRKAKAKPTSDAKSV